VYAGFSDGTVTAFDRHTGLEVWQPIDLSAEAEQRLGDIPKYLDVDTTPEPGTIDGQPVVYVGSYEGGVFALDAETGSIVSSNPDVLGVVEVSIWREPAHPALDPNDAPTPERELPVAGRRVDETKGALAVTARLGGKRHRLSELRFEARTVERKKLCARRE
jgi:outer membrane protein assembly factor BamB